MKKAKKTEKQFLLDTVEKIKNTDFIFLPLVLVAMIILFNQK